MTFLVSVAIGVFLLVTATRKIRVLRRKKPSRRVEVALFQDRYE